MKTRLRFLLDHPFLIVPPIVYLFTIAPTIGFGDTAILIDAIQRRIVEAHVNNHPFTVLTGILFSAILPFEDLAFRGNLVSAFYGILTLMGFYWIVSREVGSILVATAISAVLMVSHSMWWHSTVVENYAASAFLAMIALALWQRLEETGEERWLYWLCVAGGFSILNHIQMSFLCLGVGVTGLLYAWPKAARRWRILSNCALSALAGLLPWIIFVLRDANKTGSLAVAIKGAFVGSFSNTFFSGGLAGSLLDTIYVFWFQSPTLFLTVLGAWGAWVSFQNSPRSPRFWGLSAFFAINTFNFAFYATWDKFAFLLVSFVTLAFHGAIGLKDLLDRCEEKPLQQRAAYAWIVLSILVPPFLYGNIATWARDPNSVWSGRYNNRYSENLYFQAEFITNPNKRHYRDVERFAALLFEKLPKDATFLDDDSRTYYPLADYYQRYYHTRSDVNVVMVNSWGIANWGLGSEAVADLMTRAYHINKPFFVATIQSPTADFIRQAKAKAPVDFEPFDLGEGRWVYRMIPSSEHLKAGDKAASLDDIKGFKALFLEAPAGYIDFTLKHLLYFSVGEPTLQDMASFGLEVWKANDHIFFNNSKPNAYLELALRSSKGGKYSLALQLTGAPDFGILQAEIGETKSTVDLYNASVQPLKHELPEITLAPGVTRLILRVIEKSPRSSNYNAGIDGIHYRRLNE